MADDQTPSEGLTGSLFDRIKRIFLPRCGPLFWETSPDVLNPFFSAGGNILAGKFGDKGVEYLTESLAKSIDRLDLPQEVKATILNVIKDDDLGSLLLGYFITLNYFLSYVGGHAEVASEQAGHEWRKQYRPTFTGRLNALILSLYRDPAREGEVREMLRQHGYSDPNIDTLFKASKTIPITGRI